MCDCNKEITRMKIDFAEKQMERFWKELSGNWRTVSPRACESFLDKWVSKLIEMLRNL